MRVETIRETQCKDLIDESKSSSCNLLFDQYTETKGYLAIKNNTVTPSEVHLHSYYTP